MEISELYNLIRKEPVCLFVGSGFSLYAGMPSAGKLINDLLDSLTLNQRKKFAQTADLRKFTDDYETEFGRKKLIREIQKIFDITPSDRHLHDLLSKIPHFKSIITTNYDRLIEDSFGDKATVIVSDTDVFNPSKSRCRIFKIHGDLFNADSIVISNTDYSKHYNRNFKDPFWASLIAEISSKHVIFLGYGYEDDNIWSDFDHIESKIQNTSKKRILISPSAKPLKLKKLKKQNIDYIQADGETFINGLIADLKSNIAEDLRSGFIDAQIAQDFITGFDMKVSTNATSESTEITEISKTNGETKQSIQFTTSDQELIASYNEFKNDYHLKDFHISPEQLVSFSYLVEDFRIFNKDGLGEIKVSHTPKYDGTCKLRFADKEFILKKVKVKIYNSIAGKMLIEGQINGFVFEFNLTIANQKSDLKFKITEPDVPSPINKTYEVMRGFYLLFSGELSEIVPTKGEPISFRLSYQPRAKEFKTEMEIFHTLKLAEKVFNVKFPALKLGDISEEDKKKIQKLKALMDHGYYAIREKDGIIIEQMPDSKEVFEAFKSPVVAESYVSMVTKSGSELALFGQKLIMGTEQISLKQPTPVILDFESKRAQFIPVDHILVYHYKKFGHWDFQDSRLVWGKDDDD